MKLQGTWYSNQLDRVPDEDLIDTIWGQTYATTGKIHQGEDHTIRANSAGKQDHREHDMDR